MARSSELAKGRMLASRGFVGLVAITVIVIYLLSLITFAYSGRTNVVVAPAEVENGVDLGFEIVNVEPTKRQITLNAYVIPEGTFLNRSDRTFAKTLKLTARFQTTNEVTRTIEAGTPVGGAIEFSLIVNGNPSTYPFDQYVFGEEPDLPSVEESSEAGMLEPYFPRALVEVRTVEAGKQTPVDVGILQDNGNPELRGLPGWTEEWLFINHDDQLFMQLTMKRGGGVIAFVCVVLALMIVAAIFAGTVASSVARKQRPIEATMASWFAALLFALVPLRINLPNSPPIGAWIDVAVFYWVVMALLIAMCVFLGSWLAYRKPPED